MTTANLLTLKNCAALLTYSLEARQLRKHRSTAFRTMQHASSQRIVRGILRLIGGSTCLAFFAMFLPFDWMDVAHVWLGLGETPRQPIFAYLTRSLSAMYFAHGAIVLLVSTDVLRYLPIVKLVAFLNICLGGMLLLIDMWAGLPFYWICLEGPPIATVGCVLLWFAKDLSGA